MNEITTVEQLKAALKDAERKHAAWLADIKASCKRTGAYSESRKIWQDVQHRMASPFCYSEESQKCFMAFWRRTEKATAAAHIRIDTTK